jgi:AraC-like DNA-binding protein
MMIFSTKAVPEDEGFDRWREEFASRVFNADVIRLDQPAQEPFRTLDQALQLGELALTSCSGSPKGFSRSRKQASDGDDSFTFCINRWGRIELEQSGAATADDRPLVTLFDHSKPLERFAITHNERTQGKGVSVKSYNFTVPRRLILEAAPAAQEQVGKPLRQHERALQYLVWYTENLLRAPIVVAEPALAQRAGEHIFDFLAMLLGPTRDAAEIAAGRGWREGRLTAILSFVAANISDPRLGPRMIAEAHGISVRYVSQLMEGRGETISRYILRARLEKVARKLSDAAALHMRVGDLALACGFNDISSFNRAFKNHFGDSPRAYRRARANSAPS